METIFQSIEILSKEKGIDPQIVLGAADKGASAAQRRQNLLDKFRLVELAGADVD